MAHDALRETLNRVADWEHHYQSHLPHPSVQELKGLEERAADWITNFAGSMRFVYLHAGWFALWVVFNLGLIAAVSLGALQPFDPFPFGLLTLVVSLEAIFLSTFVMISQNRQAAVADRRAELDYQVNCHADAQIAKLVALVEALVAHHAEVTLPDQQRVESSAVPPTA